jgi:hypothetical protein
LTHNNRNSFRQWIQSKHGHFFIWQGGCSKQNFNRYGTRASGGTSSSCWIFPSRGIWTSGSVTISHVNDKTP